MTPLEKVLSRLHGVKPCGEGQYKALCPAHDDKNPSLSVTEAADGKVLIRCHAGCDYRSIVKAVGLETTELFPASNGRKPMTQRGQQQPEAVYDYHDERGNLRFQVVRFPGKQFRQRRPNGASGWEWNLKAVDRVLYRLPEVTAAVKRGEQIFIVEGEKDADRLCSLGFIATTNAGGAGQWQDNYTEVLAGADVVIFPDNDEPGRKHGKEVAESLRDTARTVKVIRLPGLDDKGDVSDWLNAGGSIEKLQEIVAGTPAVFGRTPSVLRLADVEREETVWLWHERIPLGKLTLVEGDPGLGKSWLTLVLAANITKGWPLPDDGDNPIPREPANVILLSAEDGAGDTIRPRLEDAGADLERVFLLTGSKEDPDAGISLERDLDLLDMTAERVKPLLVVVDPLQAYLGAGVDMHRSNETRPVLAALARFAERHGCAVIIVRHLRKASGDKAIYRGMGSIDFTGAARSVLRVGQDPNDEKTRVIVQVKTNLGPMAEGLAFTIDAGQFRWLGTSSVTADQMDAPQDEDTKTKLEEAMDFLREELADGPRPSAELIKDARKQLDISERTLKRAKARMGIEHYRETTDDGRALWYWCLSTRQVCPNDTVGTLAHMTETASTSDFEPCMQLCQPNIPGTLAHLESEDELPW
jgi:putative DNA primase/helicase